MAENLHIFLRTDQPIENLAAELESLLGIDLSRKEDRGTTRYEFRDESTYLSLKRHTYLSDLDMNMEDYPYDIEMWSGNLVSNEERLMWRDQIVYGIYNKLKSQDLCCLMLVDNLEYKLDEYCP